jgi:hypothetical protein
MNLRKKLPLYFLIAFITANILYMILAPLMIMEKIEKDTASVSQSRGSR